MEHSALENGMNMQKTAKELHKKERFGEKVTKKLYFVGGGGERRQRHKK